LIHDRLIEARELIAVINDVIKQKIVRMRSLPSAASACLTLSGYEGAKVIHLKELTNGLVTHRDWYDNCVAGDGARLPFTLALAAS
jgi:hypothetical protein